jgi:hypothetical protein
VDVALFVSGGVQITGDTLVESGGLLKAGPATQRRCSADNNQQMVIGEDLDCV